MEKIVKVGEYEFPARSNAATLLSYRRNFGRDGMKDLLALVKGVGNKNANDADSVVQAFADGSFEIETLYRYIWTFAKSADKEIPPMEFVSEVFPQISDLLFSMAKTNVKSKKK